ncbi:MAG: class I SAM-dependent methyltransferase [Sandaracinus sp.]|nr:class I SAM-dependent methyltransferase [Sandaracinus sp.]
MSEGYIHGYSEEERRRLVAQAELWRDRFLVPGLDYRPGEKLLEIGCGVGAVLAVLGEHFPGLNLTGVDLVPSQIAAAKDELASRGLSADLRVADAAAFALRRRELRPRLRRLGARARPRPPPDPSGGPARASPRRHRRLPRDRLRDVPRLPRPPRRGLLGRSPTRALSPRRRPHVARALGARLVAAGFEDVASGPMGFHYFTGDPELARFTNYLLGFLEPMVPRLAELGFEEARLREGVAAMRALPSLPEASVTQFAFRATARTLVDTRRSRPTLGGLLWRCGHDAIACFVGSGALARRVWR